MSLGSDLAKSMKRSAGQLKKESEEVSWRRMYETTLRKMMSNLDILPARINALFREERLEACDVWREFPESPLDGFTVVTGYVELSDLFNDPMALDVWREFFSVRKERGRAAVAFKCKGVGVMVMCLPGMTERRRGEARIVIPGGDGSEIAVKPFHVFVKENL